MSQQIDYKFTLESFFRTTESFEDKRITASFIAIALEIASQIKMSKHYTSDQICEKSLTQLAKQTRQSKSTVQREIRKILAMGIFERTGYSETGKPIFEAGHQWFSEQICIIERKRQIAKCGTRADSMNTEQPVSKSVTPSHSEQGGVVRVNRGGSQSDQHITNAFTVCMTKKLVEQQQDYKIINDEQEQKPMIETEPLNEDEMATQNTDGLQTVSHKLEAIKPERKNLFKNARVDYINSVQDHKLHNLTALAKMAKKLGKEKEFNHNAWGLGVEHEKRG